MSSLKLLHSGGNGVIISAPSSNPASNRTITVPGNADGEMLTTTNPKTGNIIQVVHSSYNTATTVTATTYADSGLTATITPSSASNKILVMYSQGFRMNRSGDTATSAAIQLYRTVSSTTTAITDNANYMLYAEFGDTTSQYVYDVLTQHLLDSPNTTSAVTYKTMQKAYTASTSIITQYNAKSFMTLMEVAG